MDNKDALQIKIDEAKTKLSQETLEAINAIDWRASVLGMREKKGYSFSQLEDLEIETELLLYGLLKPEDYPKELEVRMKISKEDANELVNQLNELIFNKIRGELVKNSEKRKVPITSEKAEPLSNPLLNKERAKGEVDLETKRNTEVLDQSGIQIVQEVKKTSPVELQPREEKELENRADMLTKVENPEPTKMKEQDKTTINSLLNQKLGSSFSVPSVETKHSEIAAKHPPLGSSKTDPYRESVE